MTDRTYIAIDLKSFYASVECMDRQLEPMTTNLKAEVKRRFFVGIVQQSDKSKIVEMIRWSI